jgi:hypothetical protein
VKPTTIQALQHSKTSRHQKKSSAMRHSVLLETENGIGENHAAFTIMLNQSSFTHSYSLSGTVHPRIAHENPEE